MNEQKYIFDTSSIKDKLVEMNRDYDNRKTWENLFGSVDLAKQRELGSLKQDYTNVVSNAYAAAYNQNIDIANSNLGQGFKQNAIDDNQLALEQAYNAYQTKYLEGLQNIETDALKATQTIDKALTDDAMKFNEFSSTMYPYLQYLREQQYALSDDENIFKTDELWKRYEKDVVDDVTGEVVDRELKSWEELLPEFIDQDGTLSAKGLDFFDQMVNERASQHKDDSYTKWLKANNPELFDWFTKPNEFDVGNTKFSTYKKLLGIDDDRYSIGERLDALNTQDVDNLFTEFTNKVTELSDAAERNDIDYLQTNVDIVDKLVDLIDTLGITEDFEKEYNVNLRDLSNQYKQLVSTATPDTKKDRYKQSMSSNVGTSTPVYGSEFWTGLLNLTIDSKEKEALENGSAPEQSSTLYSTLVDNLIKYTKKRIHK